MTAAIDPWAFQPHPEVWLLVGAIVALGVYAVRVIGPLVVEPGEPVVTGRQKLAFGAGVVVLWVAADWPMHDIAEEYLYSVHMVQHLLIAFVVPPLLLLATPSWLARLVILEGGTASKVLRVLTRPVVAGVAFNAVQVLTHWSGLVELSAENGAFHYLVHLLVFGTALMMWFPVVGPLEELQLSSPGKMLYLFLMSIVPTVPAGWLTFAEGAVYPVYDTPERLWAISVTSDQQAAGVVMKVIGGFYLWTIIAIMFFRYVAVTRDADLDRRRRRTVTERLTYEEVAAEFDRSGPAEHEAAAGER